MRRPQSTGVYYWLWMDPHWQLEAFPHTLYPEVESHSDAWPFCAYELACYYRIPHPEREKLEGILHAFPRGRVLIPQEYSRSPSGVGPRFLIRHGGDAHESGWEDEVLLAFGLGLGDNGVPVSVAFDCDEAEAALPEDVAQLWRLGIVPPAQPGMTGRVGSGDSFSKPETGVYYWLWLAPHWKLVAFPQSEHPEVDSHADAWPVCARRMAEHYRIPESDRVELEELTYALPRGRVATPLVRQVTAEVPPFRVYHGGDAPVADWKEAVLRAFGLAGNGGTAFADFLSDEHEITQEDDQARLRKLGIVLPRIRERQEK